MRYFIHKNLQKRLYVFLLYLTKKRIKICMAGLRENNWKEIVLRIYLNFYHAINSKSSGVTQFRAP